MVQSSENNAMKGRVCVITGGTSGIGKATALGLAKMGATIVVVGRDQTRGEQTRDEIREQSGNKNVDALTADLSSRAEIMLLALNIKARFPQLHVLINNAGISPLKRSVTVDGTEAIFAVNYLAPFLLTNLLLDPLIGSAPARVVNVAGDIHRKERIQFDDLMSEKAYRFSSANNQAKLALIMFTYELARRLAGKRVTASCLHPGAVRTGAPLKDPDLSPFARIMYKLVRPFFLSPTKGAQTSVYLASSPEVENISGKYFIKKRQVSSSPESYDEEKARRLWEVSEKLSGLTECVVPGVVID